MFSDSDMGEFGEEKEDEDVGWLRYVDGGESGCAVQQAVGEQSRSLQVSQVGPSSALYSYANIFT